MSKPNLLEIQHYKQFKHSIYSPLIPLKVEQRSWRSTCFQSGNLPFSFNRTKGRLEGRLELNSRFSKVVWYCNAHNFFLFFASLDLLTAKKTQITSFSTEGSQSRKILEK